MNITATLFGQTITFFLFVWFVMKFVWPPLITALDERKKTIADGLAAAEKGQKAQEEAQSEVDRILKEARAQANEIVAQAQKRSNEIVDEAAQTAKDKAAQIAAAAEADIEQEVVRAREALRGQVAGLAVMGAGKILETEIDESAHAKLLDDLAAQI